MSDTTIEHGVIVGRDGHLFLADGGHFVLDIVTGRKIIPDGSFNSFSTNVLGRAECARKYGAQFVHIIFPDKQSVLQASFPFPSPICLGELYCAKFPSIASSLMNLTDLLRGHEFPTFQKTDTHMTDLALIAVAQHIAEYITGVNLSTSGDLLRKKPALSRFTAGDLGKRFAPERKNDESFISIDWPLAYFQNGITGGNDGMIDLLFSSQAMFKRRILWFGDSFGRSCIRFLSFFFSEIVFLRTRFFHEEVMFQVRPDVLITQNVERYLDNVEADINAPPFFLYPFLKKLPYAPNSDFINALSAVFSFPRPAYRHFIDSVFRLQGD